MAKVQDGHTSGPIPANRSSKYDTKNFFLVRRNKIRQNFWTDVGVDDDDGDGDVVADQPTTDLTIRLKKTREMMPEKEREC